jgi:hypothetical protein
VPRTAGGGRSAFVRNEDLSVPGFRDKESAVRAAAAIPRADERRVKVAYRSRTSTYDVVVKDKRDVGP